MTINKATLVDIVTRLILQHVVGCKIVSQKEVYLVVCGYTQDAHQLQRKKRASALLSHRCSEEDCHSNRPSEYE